MAEILIIRQPKTEKEFELMYNLRWRVLRKPWDRPRGSEKDEDESISSHFIAIADNKIIGTARYHKINEKVGRVRYLAVAEEYRGRGVARSIMEAIDLTACNQNLKYLILSARHTAAEFFKKMGYKIMGEGKTLFGEIKHYKMVKKFKENISRMQEIIDNLRKTLDS